MEDHPTRKAGSGSGLNRRGSIPADVANALRAVVDQLDWAVFVLSIESRVLFANEPAQHLCAGSNTFRLSQRRLSVGGVPVVRALLQNSRIGERTHVMALADRKSHDHGDSAGVRYRLLLARSSLRRASDLLVLHVHDAARPRQLDSARLRVLYHLTASEAQIVAQLASGADISQTAKKMRVSRETIRSHLKRVFSKCGVSSQRELVRLVVSGP